MDLSRQGLQTNGKLFSNFELLAKNKKIFEWIERERGVNIDQSAMYYLSMDSSRHALQTYESFEISE